MLGSNKYANWEYLCHNEQWGEWAWLERGNTTYVQWGGGLSLGSRLKGTQLAWSPALAKKVLRQNLVCNCPLSQIPNDSTSWLPSV